MPASKAQQRAVNKYMANNYDRINLTVPKGQKDIIKTHAEAHGESVNAFIGRAIAETMERDKAPQRPQEAPAVQDNTQAQERTEGVPLHTLEQRIRKKLYRYGGSIKKDRKSGGYTVVYEDTTLDFPDYAALLEYAQGLDKD
ncbi:hypothetical protein [Flavonifractor sp. An306]|uniref:hypothetical protein n=1 Tax=Flavonifractor sp. An306 TaxID=1965629 RepID=UPI003456BB28